MTAPAAASPVPVVEISTRRVMHDIRRLASLGPREATSAGFRRAARIVGQRLETLGYVVRRQRFDVPGGTSWGVPVRAGESFNVVATTPGFDPARPYLLVGAHLDTVPQSPGANDNASGVAILLELARLAGVKRTEMPIVFVAFGAEEPRAPGDAGHHYGSRHHAKQLRGAERRALEAVLAIDRVGYGARVRVCTGGLSPPTLLEALVRTARRLRLPAERCRNRTSDHWPFERDGFTVARLDGGRFPGYHSPRDTPNRVDVEQVGRTAHLAWEMLRRIRPGDLR